jgi:nucleoside-diphosphate-sugar epimerase
VTGVVLITGGAGSLGKRLAERFVATGWQVRVFDLPNMDFSGLEERQEVRIIKGDIGDKQVLGESVAGVDSVLHLAALLPPRSERDRATTMTVNVDGTATVVGVMEELAPGGKLVFASSVSTYGDTSAGSPPVGTDCPQRAIDAYAESKITAESLIRVSPLNSVILRVAPIAVPAFLEPPEVWPFTPNQRVEMVHRDDVADAFYSSVASTAAARKVFNIAGGPTWQLEGKSYVNDFYGFLGAPVEDATYRTSPGWVDWYDTEESQRLLGYQNRSYQHFSEEMRALISDLMAS